MSTLANEKKVVSKWLLSYLTNPVVISVPCIFIAINLIFDGNQLAGLCRAIAGALSGNEQVRQPVEFSCLSCLYWALTLIAYPLQIYCLRALAKKNKAVDALRLIANSNLSSGLWPRRRPPRFNSLALIGIVLLVCLPLLGTSTLADYSPHSVGKLILFTLQNWFFTQMLTIFVAIMRIYAMIQTENK